MPPVGRLGYLASRPSTSSRAPATWSCSAPASPVAFFAYPGKPGDLVPAGLRRCTCGAASGAARRGALEELADLVAGGAPRHPRRRAAPRLPTGPLTVASAAAVVGALLPEGAVVVDEANTSGSACPPRPPARRATTG